MVDKVFCTVNDVKTLTPIHSAWTGFNTALGAIIPAATGQIKTFCRRTFEVGSYTEYFLSPMEVPARIHVIEPPITSSSIVFVYDKSGRFVDSALSTSLVEDTDFTVNYDTGLITLTGEFEYSRRGLKIVYTGGYPVVAESPPRVQVPAQVVQACAIQAAFLLERTMAGQMGKQTSEEARAASTKWTSSATSGLVAEAQALVTPYRRPLVGRN